MSSPTSGASNGTPTGANLAAVPAVPSVVSTDPTPKEVAYGATPPPPVRKPGKEVKLAVRAEVRRRERRLMAVAVPPPPPPAVPQIQLITVPQGGQSGEYARAERTMWLYLVICGLSCFVLVIAGVGVARMMGMNFTVGATPVAAAEAKADREAADKAKAEEAARVERERIEREAKEATTKLIDALKGGGGGVPNPLGGLSLNTPAKGSKPTRTTMGAPDDDDGDDDAAAEAKRRADAERLRQVEAATEALHELSAAVQLVGAAKQDGATLAAMATHMHDYRMYATRVYPHEYQTLQTFGANLVNRAEQAAEQLASLRGRAETEEGRKEIAVACSKIREAMKLERAAIQQVFGGFNKLGIRAR